MGVKSLFRMQVACHQSVGMGSIAGRDSVAGKRTECVASPRRNLKPSPRSAGYLGHQVRSEVAQQRTEALSMDWVQTPTQLYCQWPRNATSDYGQHETSSSTGLFGSLFSRPAKLIRNIVVGSQSSMNLSQVPSKSLSCSNSGL